MNNSRLVDLFAKQLSRTATPAEREELMGLLAAPENQEQAMELLGSAWEDFQPKNNFFSKSQSNRVLAEIIPETVFIAKSSRLINPWIKYASVAVLLLTLSVTYLFFAKNDQQIVVSEHKDIGPGGNAATLTLASGRKIFLSDSLKGTVAEEMGVHITKTTDGQIVYHISDVSQASSTAINTISTSNGEQFQVTLPDGTRVWLNAASSIRFPISFSKALKRKVELNGEAFFEVSKDKKHPFIVKTIAQEVEVLGTHFNISAYEDERATKTTLVEGSVNVTTTQGYKNSKVLKPGQQAVIADETLRINHSVDLEDVLAWKNGYFKFNESLENIMTKISRWYNVKVIYEVDPDADMAFEGKISRTKKLSALLKNIEMAGGVHFKIEGRRVTVIK